MVKINKLLPEIRKKLEFDELHNLAEISFKTSSYFDLIEKITIAQIRDAYVNAFIYELLFLEEIPIRNFFKSVLEISKKIIIKKEPGKPAKIQTRFLEILKTEAEKKSWEFIKENQTGQMLKPAFNRYGRHVLDIQRRRIPEPQRTHLMDWRTGRRGESGLSYEIQRDVRTGTTDAVNTASIDVYKMAGINYYRYCSILDDRLCGNCHELNGKIFPVNEAQEGVNLPALHPNCRCYIEPVY